MGGSRGLGEATADAVVGGVRVARIFSTIFSIELFAQRLDTYIQKGLVHTSHSRSPLVSLDLYVRAMI